MGRGYEDSGGASTGVSKRWCLGSGGSSAQALGLCVVDLAGHEPGMAWDASTVVGPGRDE